MDRGAFGHQVGKTIELFSGKPAGTAWSAPFPQRLDPAPFERPLPSGSRSAANPEFTGNLGLSDSVLQVLSSFQTPAFHFVAI